MCRTPTNPTPLPEWPLAERQTLPPTGVASGRATNPTPLPEWPLAERLAPHAVVPRVGRKKVRPHHVLRFSFSWSHRADEGVSCRSTSTRRVGYD